MMFLGYPIIVKYSRTPRCFSFSFDEMSWLFAKTLKEVVLCSWEFSTTKLVTLSVIKRNFVGS